MLQEAKQQVLCEFRGKLESPVSSGVGSGFLVKQGQGRKGAGRTRGYGEFLALS